MRTLILLICTSSFIFAQSEWTKVETTDIFNLIQKQEENIDLTESYALSANMKIFRSSKEQFPTETSENYIVCRAGKEINIFQKNMIILQNKDINVSIDTADKKIIYNHPNPQFFKRKDEEDLKEYLKIAEQTHRKVNGKQTIYKVSFNANFPLKEVEYTYNEYKEINNIKLISQETIDMEDDKEILIQPIVTIDLQYINKGSSVDFKNFINPADVVQRKNIGVIKTEEYKNYQIIDLRN